MKFSISNPTYAAMPDLVLGEPLDLCWWLQPQMILMIELLLPKKFIGK